jgi:HEPN domain-containing protein
MNSKINENLSTSTDNVEEQQAPNKAKLPMNSQQKFEYWLDIAQYDLKTADAMYKTGRWLYVAFMCQQAIEKLVKGLYILYNNDKVPKIHNIGKVIKKFENKLHKPITDELYSFFDNLATYYIEARYPDYKAKLSLLLDKDVAKSILTKSEEVFK